MKICCDVCDKQDAAVFCPADEAALCDNCDHQVHHANKLAGKHQRFSLLYPSAKESPLCDICQERRALVFCKEDRAILCRVCDLSIHQANEHTQKHSRFLLTSVMLSDATSSYPTRRIPSDASNMSKESNIKGFHQLARNPSSVSSGINNSSDSYVKEPTSSSVSTSSISEYLMETIPGWQVEDLDFPSLSCNFFCTSSESLLLNWNEESSINSFPSGNLSFWEPQLSNQSPQFHLQQSHGGITFDGMKGPKEANSVKVNRKLNDDAITVPEISPPSLKKFRYF